MTLIYTEAQWQVKIAKYLPLRSTKPKKAKAADTTTKKEAA